MADIHFFGLTNNDLAWIDEPFEFSNLISQSSTSVIFRTFEGRIITLQGSNLFADTFNFLLTGTITQIEMSNDLGTFGTVDMRVSDISLDATELFSSGLTTSNSDESWQLILEGETNIQADNAFLLGFGGDGSTLYEQDFTGNDARFRGVLRDQSEISGSFSFFAGDGGTLTGGSFNFFGQAERIAGDAATARGNVTVIGGDDRLVLSSADVSALPNTRQIAGDVLELGFDAFLYGGDDDISARRETEAFNIEISGDALEIVGGGGLRPTVYGGDDIIRGPSDTGATMIGDAGTAEFGGGPEFNLFGGDDTIYGGAGYDRIYGDSGDYQDGHVGGNDMIYGGSGGADAYGQGGNDMIMIERGGSRAYGGDGNDRIYAGADFFEVDGDAGDDHITLAGLVYEAYVYGGADFDTLDFSLSNEGAFIRSDSFIAEGVFGGYVLFFGFERFIGSDQAGDQIYRDGTGYTIETRGGDDFVSAGGGGDTVRLGKGRDRVEAGDGANSYYGGNGFDLVDYGLSTAGVKINLDAKTASGGYAAGDKIRDMEYVYASIYDDHLTGTNGANILDGKDGDDKLFGLKGGDLLVGDDGDDRIFGGKGNDNIKGGKGSDFIVAGKGNDQVKGGADADTFHFNKGDGVMRIKDFENNVDLVEIDGYTQPFKKADKVGDDVVFSFGSGDFLIVEDMGKAMLRNDLEVV